MQKQIATLQDQLVFSKRYIEDELYFKNHHNRSEDKYQMILSIAVAPEYRHRGIASHLLDKMVEIAKSQVERQSL